MATTNRASAEDVARQLRLRMADSPAGKKLPTRVELMKQYDASRATIEKAVASLIQEGFLTARVGSGTFVSGGTERPARDHGLWGIIVPNICSDIYPELIRGIEDFTQQIGVNVVVCNSDSILEKQSRSLEMLISRDVDGLIIVPAVPIEGTADTFAPWLNTRKPIIFCNRAVPGVHAPRIASNSYYGAHIAVRHLLDQGYRRIAYAGSRRYSQTEERYMGYQAALFERGITLDPALVVFSEPENSPQPGAWAARRLLSLPDKPDAIMCFNDEVAFNAYRVVTAHGLRVGHDFGLVGYDDSGLCQTTDPRLTSVHFPKYAVGRRSAELMHAYLTGTPYDPGYYEVHMPHIVVRGSSLRDKD